MSASPVPGATCKTCPYFKEPKPDSFAMVVGWCEARLPPQVDTWGKSSTIDSSSKWCAFHPRIMAHYQLEALKEARREAREARRAMVQGRALDLDGE